MIINMKPTHQEREILLQKLLEGVSRSGISQAELASASGVDPSQVCRILAGEFVTFAGAVVRICKVLNITPDAEPPKTGATTRTGPSAARRASWSKVERAIRKLWDETPEGADRLVRVLDAIAAVSERPPATRPAPSGQSVQG